jgi:hypothetical protein
MAQYRLETGATSAAAGLGVGSAMALAGLYFLAISLWPPSLFALAYLGLAAAGGLVAWRGWERMQEVRAGKWPAAVDIGEAGLTFTYADGRAEAHPYDQVAHAALQGMDGRHWLQIELAGGRRYQSDIPPRETEALRAELRRFIGKRFAEYEGARRTG